MNYFEGGELRTSSSQSNTLTNYISPLQSLRQARSTRHVADAEEIVEAAMRFVTAKTEDQQVRAMLLRTRQMFVGQRTQMINALRGQQSRRMPCSSVTRPVVRSSRSIFIDRRTSVRTRTYAKNLTPS